MFLFPSRSRSNLLGHSKGSIDAITQTLEELDMDEHERNRIKLFLQQKEQMGEIRDEDLEKLGELGSGKWNQRLFSEKNIF